MRRKRNTVRYRQLRRVDPDDSVAGDLIRMTLGAVLRASRHILGALGAGVSIFGPGLKPGRKEFFPQGRPAPQSCERRSGRLSLKSLI